MPRATQTRRPRRPGRPPLWPLLPVLASLALIGCLREDMLHFSQPGIRLVSPASSQLELPFTVEVAVENFELADSGNGVAAEGEGHWQLLVDGQYHARASALRLEVGALTPGTHSLEAQLIDREGVPIDPPVRSEPVTIDVAAPTVTLLSPSPGAVTSPVPVSIAVSSFVLDPEAMAGEPEAGHGHWHVIVDGIFEASAGTTSYQLHGLTEGVHTIQAELVQNNHKPLDPRVLSEVVEVFVGAPPSITLVSPGDGGVDFPLEVAVEVGGVELNAPQEGAAPARGSGHWHLEIDGVVDPVHHASPTTMIDILAGGAHTLRARLVNDDESELDPAVASAPVTIHVEPRIEILSPADQADVSEYMLLEVGVEDFLLTRNTDGDAGDGYGHFHVYVDESYFMACFEVSCEVGPLAAGGHQIRVELADSSHYPLTPSATDIIEVRVREE